MAALWSSNRCMQLKSQRSARCALGGRSCYRLSAPLQHSRNNRTARAVIALATQYAAVGVDLGTTTSAVALIDASGRAQIVEDHDGKAIIPSVVHYQEDGSVLVGQAAVDAGTSNAASTFYSIKRLIGRPHSQVQDMLPGLTYRLTGVLYRYFYAACLFSYYMLHQSYAPGVVEGADGSTLLACSTAAAAAVGTTAAATATATANLSQQVLLSPVEVSAQIVRHLVHRAQAFLGSTQQIREAVVTVPAYFNVAQRRATVEAAKQAGLLKVTLLQEPIAAAMAYGFGKPTDWDTLLVFDLGGGTLDLSLLEVFDGIMEVVSTGGDAKLGGDDFTAAAVAMVTAALPQSLQQLLAEGSASPNLRLALRRAAEEAKIGLSMHEEVEVKLHLAPGDQAAAAAADGAGQLAVRVSRDQLDTASQQLLTRLWPPLEHLAKDTRTQLGGRPPDLLPAWQQQQQEPGASSCDAASTSQASSSSTGSDDDTNSDASLAVGAAAGLRHSFRHGRTFSVFTSEESQRSGAKKYSAPPRKITGVVLVGAATRMPGVRKFIQHVTGLPPAAGVAPEEVVALGAAIHAGVLQGSSSGVELTDGSYVAEQHNRASALLSDWQP